MHVLIRLADARAIPRLRRRRAELLDPAVSLWALQIESVTEFLEDIAKSRLDQTVELLSSRISKTLTLNGILGAFLLRFRYTNQSLVPVSSRAKTSSMSSSEGKMSESFALKDLSAAVSGSAAAFRSTTILQPVGGEGDKVFPATFAGGQYAKEKRRDQESKADLECVLLDSVASQANRAELALLDAIHRGELTLPLIEVDFSEANQNMRTTLPTLTSLEAPHRLADAILRDSQLPDGTRFSKSDYAARWRKANTWNSTPVYELCPTALVFGMWGSPDKPGGLGAKFERAYVSEIVGIDTLFVEKRSGFRIDPESISSKVGIIPGENGTFIIAKDAKAKGAIRPSEINHGNVVYDSTNGGVRFARAEQVTVVSLGALRKLRFPVNNQKDQKVNDAGRTVLAALALCAGVLAVERGTSLRSRCHLWPVSERHWEILEKPGQVPRTLALSGKDAITILNQAVAAAEALGLKWNTQKISLKPTPELVALIRQSQEVQSKEGGEGEVS